MEQIFDDPALGRFTWHEDPRYWQAPLALPSGRTVSLDISPVPGEPEDALEVFAAAYPVVEWIRTSEAEAHAAVSRTMLDLYNATCSEEGPITAEEFARRIERVTVGVSPASERAGIRDLRNLLWCSIDNDASRDLDQLTVGEQLAAGRVKVLVAVADVDALVKPGSPIDRHAAANTTSVYTAARIFPMLPERLSTDLTSLNKDADRLAVVVEMVVAPDGSVEASEVYRALVRNHAKLAYRGVAAWLGGTAAPPERVARTAGLDEQLRLQDRIAHVMRAARYGHGALDFETLEPEAVLRDGRVVDLRLEGKNRAKELIEDFMIAANGVVAAFLEKRGSPTLQRVVREPERWDRIREVAAGFGDPLPAAPDSRALGAFLARRRAADALRFPDLSLTVVKLMGAGEYAIQLPGQEPTGHFGLAVHDYSHSTAPNRRFPDIITQRLLKAIIAGGTPPYSPAELEALAAHCRDREDAARKVERQVRKSAAAQVLSGRIGETFDALVTGASEKGTWVRLLTPPVEGKLIGGQAGLDVGDQIRVELVGLNVPRGFIDFVRKGQGPAGRPSADQRRENGDSVA